MGLEFRESLCRQDFESFLEEYNALPSIWASGIPTTGPWIDLIPKSISFYEYLCGEDSGAKNLFSFITEEWATFVQREIDDDVINGLLKALSFSVNHDMVEAIPTAAINQEHIDVVIKEIIRGKHSNQNCCDRIFAPSFQDI